MGIGQRIKNVFFPNDYRPGIHGNKDQPQGKRISSYISKFQFARAKQDIAAWREAVTEAELAWYPFRVKMQRIFIDTVLNGHVDACMTKRKNLVLLKEFGFYSGETCNEEFTTAMKNEWFYNLMNYIVDARFYGYSLIEFGDLTKNAFNDLTIVRRWNVSPDRLNLTSLTYSISGLNFMDPSLKGDDGESYYDWSLYIDTPSDIGASKCGYGLLYKVAPYEILLRNIQAFNADYAESFGQPLKWAKSNKLEGEEYDKLEEALANMASNPYLITDNETQMEFLAAKGSGSGSDIYASFEERLEKKITKIILGHASAMDAVPGKLGSNDDIKDALKQIETVDTRMIEHVINNQLIPKLQSIGFPIPNGVAFKFKNDKEKEEIRAAQDASNKLTADIAKTLKDAGLKMDPAYFTERTGIKVTEVEVEPVTEGPTDKTIQNAIKEIYDIA